MNIQFDDDEPRVAQASVLANQLLQDPLFYEKIAQHQRFDLTSPNATPEVISELLKNSSLIFNVEIFYPSVFGSLFKYRKTLAYTDARYPNTLFLNFKRLDRDVAEIAATIIHEAIHALDDEQTEFTFGHGNNSSVGKENTAPYWIGNLAYNMLSEHPEEQNLTFDQNEI